MRKNFTIRAFVDLAVGGLPIPLHDCYVAGSVATDLTGQTIILCFRRERRWPGPEALPEEVRLTCSGNLGLMFNELMGAHRSSSEPSVTIGYYDDRCEWDELLDEETAAAQGFAGLHIDFSDRLVLRIRADNAEVTTC